jgi:hypothetical protein
LFDNDLSICLCILNLAFEFGYAPDLFLGACWILGSKSANVNDGFITCMQFDGVYGLPIIFDKF